MDILDLLSYIWPQVSQNCWIIVFPSSTFRGKYPVDVDVTSYGNHLFGKVPCSAAKEVFVRRGVAPSCWNQVRLLHPSFPQTRSPLALPGRRSGRSFWFLPPQFQRRDSPRSRNENSSCSPLRRVWLFQTRISRNEINYVAVFKVRNNILFVGKCIRKLIPPGFFR